MSCPKCGHRRTARDPQTHPDICPACGIAMSKFLARQQHAAEPVPVVARASLWAPFKRPPRYSASARWCSKALLATLLVWTLWFAVHGVDWEVIGGSFMHHINLPFHEFGHLAFMPFGRFMAILGGSLFQVLLPLGLLLAFSLQQRDNFGAAVCLWWAGQSLVDLSPYIQDAVCRCLPLIGGMGEEAHDWGNLLTMTHTLHYAGLFAKLAFGAGVLLMLAALAWGWYLVRAMDRQAPENDPPDVLT